MWLKADYVSKVRTRSWIEVDFTLIKIGLKTGKTIMVLQLPGPQAELTQFAI